MYYLGTWTLSVESKFVCFWRVVLMSNFEGALLGF